MTNPLSRIPKTFWLAMMAASSIAGRHIPNFEVASDVAATVFFLIWSFCLWKEMKAEQRVQDQGQPN